MSKLADVQKYRLEEIRKLMAQYPRTAMRIPREQVWLALGYKPPFDQLTKTRTTALMKGLGFVPKSIRYNGKEVQVYELGNCSRYVVTDLKFENGRATDLENISIDEWLVSKKAQAVEPKVQKPVSMKSVPSVLALKASDPWVVRAAWVVHNYSTHYSLGGLVTGIVLGLIVTKQMM